jgi:thiamine biosynthesis lipoprotein
VQRLAIVLFLLILIGIAGCARAPEEITLSGPTMGTTYNVRVVDAPRALDSHAIRVAIDAVLDSIDRSMSGYRDDSEVARFNASTSTDWFEVSPNLATVVGVARDTSAASGGAFDITVAPLVSLWGFGRAGEPAALPDEAAIQAAQSRSGYQWLEVRAQPAALRKKLPGLTIDLNGIAPGFAVDELARHFAALGIANFMIDIGGEVMARGCNAQGEHWHIAVEKPVDTQPEPFVILKLADLSVTTSGEYRHYYVRDGHRYSHTIDPRTGRPVEHNLASVVLIGSTSVAIDAWATALNVLGADAGLKLATQRGMPAMFIVQEGDQFRTKMTPGFAAHVIGPERRSLPGKQ